MSQVLKTHPMTPTIKTHTYSEMDDDGVIFETKELKENP